MRVPWKRWVGKGWDMLLTVVRATAPDKGQADPQPERREPTAEELWERWRRQSEPKLWFVAGALSALVIGGAALEAQEAQEAQAPNACLTIGRAAADSLARRHLASTVLTQYQVRSAARLDSLLQARCATPGVARVEVGFDYLTTPLWPIGYVGALPQGAGTVCASVVVGGVWHLGETAVYATIVGQDSVMWVERPERVTSGLRQLCFQAALAAGHELTTRTPTWPVRWQSVRVRFAALPVAVPSPEAVLP